MIKLLVVLCFAFLAVNAAGRTSPCPAIFEYKSSGPGFWEGELNVVADYKLYGTWIRLIFDGPVSSVETNNSSPHALDTVSRDDNSVLLKNNDLVLSRGQPVKVQFKVNYKGDEAPSLVQYRLNARELCQPSADD